MKKIFNKHSPLILCFAASAGVIGTAIASAMDTPKALEKLKEKEADGQWLSKWERAKALLPHYITTIGIGVGTIICIFSIDILNKKHQTTLSNAYVLLNQLFAKYRNKIIERYGVEEDVRIVNAIIKEECDDVQIFSYDLMSANSLDPDSQIDEVTRTFYDPYSKRYFESTLSKVLQAEYHLNRNFALGKDVTVNDFYDFLGLSNVPENEVDEFSDILSDGYGWIDFNNKIETLDDGMEVICIDSMLWPSQK